MPILRNPFRKDHTQDENARPVSAPQNKTDPSADFQKVELVSAKPVTTKAIEPVEYQLSEINQNGVYVPPDTPQKKRGWTTRTNTSSSNTSSHRSMLNENEPFSISRESFDSYRRSFDISARSPVIDPDAVRPRQSLDARSARLPHALRRDSALKFNPPETQPEDRFEDVGLDDVANKPKPRKGFFSRFGESQGDAANVSSAPVEGNKPTTSHYTPSSFFSRKRGQSGQGAELGSMPVKPPSAPTTTGAEEVRVDQ